MVNRLVRAPAISHTPLVSVAPELSSCCEETVDECFATCYGVLVNGAERLFFKITYSPGDPLPQLDSLHLLLVFF